MRREAQQEVLTISTQALIKMFLLKIMPFLEWIIPPKLPSKTNSELDSMFISALKPSGLHSRRIQQRGTPTKCGKKSLLH